MATYTSDLTSNVLTACDSSTGWSELPSPHSSGSAPSSDTENYFHNSNSVSQPTGQATGQGAGIQFDNGSALTWTASSNWCFFAWAFYAAPTNLTSWSTKGLMMGIGSSDNNADMYQVGGNDFGTYPYGGWQNYCFDPEFATVDQTIGTGGGNYQNFAVLPNITAKITKGNPLAVDVVRYGRGEIKATGADATFTGMANFNDNATTGRYGLFAAQSGSYLWKGLMSLGDATTSVTFSDSNKLIRVEDTPRVKAGFNKIEINHASSSVTWTSISIQGVQTSITGAAPISAGDFEMVAGATLSFTSCTFTDLGTFVFNKGTGNCTITGTTFRRDGAITQGGATLTGCTIDSSEAASAVICDNLTLISGCDFISAGTGHALDLGTGVTTQSVTWNNTHSGYAATDGSTGNEVIKVAVADNNTLTINVSGGDTPTVYNASTGNGAVVVQSSVPISVTVVDGNNDPITSANVRVEETDGTLVAQGAANGGTNSNVFSSSYGGSTPLTVRIKVRTSSGATRYFPVRTGGSIESSTGLATTVSMTQDTIAS